VRGSTRVCHHHVVRYPNASVASRRAGFPSTAVGVSHVVAVMHGSAASCHLRPELSGALTVTDLFSGAGGATAGALQAGLQVRLAINHFAAAVDSHAANHPEVDHDRQDLTVVAPSRYRRTDILLASPSCTGFSRAMNRSVARPHAPAESLSRQLAKAGDRERSRAHAWTVTEWAEHHRYDVVVVENVVEFAGWPPFQAWAAAMGALGYDHQICSLNAAFTGVPQSRDRLYVVFRRRGIAPFDLDLHPEAPCVPCGTDVAAVQVFKPGRTFGCYGAQYTYRCPYCEHRVAPYTPPASAVLDVALRGQRVAGRSRPLADDTLRRLREGCRRFRAGTLSQGWYTPDRPVDQTAAFVSKQFRGDRGHPLAKPLGAITALDHHALIHVDAARPVPSRARFRMLTTDELCAGMGLPAGYQLVGNTRIRARLIGNAVCPPVMTHICKAITRQMKGQVAA
jgi:DNA (cytosine-5)-methyltransferase 1